MAEPSAADNHHVEGPPSIRTILVGVDESATARRAAESAAALARATGAHLHVVTALPPARMGEVRGPGGDTWHVDPIDAARDRLNDMAASWPDVKTDVVCEMGKPVDVLIRTAERIDADVIVVGNRRMQGVSRVLGAVASDVAHRAPCDVYIVYTVDG